MDNLSSPVRRPLLVVRARRGWVPLNLRELWGYRDLLLLLATRDVKLRYKQTALGVAWVILQPLAAALIFALIFGRFARLPSDGAPYLLFVFAGLLPWNLFSGTLQRAGSSLLADARLITKIYFPRLLIPIASTGAVLIDFVVTLLVFFGFMALYGFVPSWRILALPLFLLLALVAAVGASLWLAALNVRYRDFMYAMPFLIQLWLYLSPVVYPASLLPEHLRLLFSLNPAVGFIEGFRWALLGASALTPEMLLISSSVAIVLLLSGMLFFRQVERSFADII